MDLRATTPMAAVREDLSESQVVSEALTTEYEILEELGRGGMAVVFKAREKQLDRVVAIKVLPLSLAFDADFVERFQREARTAAKLEHSNIIPIYRVGQAGRVSYFVMKYLRGKPLAEMIEARGPLAPAEIRRLLVQTASALGYAHRHGIVHRDIKPDNIMFDDAENAVVMDFGIAKAASGSRLTGTGMSIGTPHYMSPEQARAKEIDGRSDLYSLGVVAYQCLTGRVPFDGEDAFAIGYKHVMDPLPTPKLDAPEQRELFVVIRRMLAKSPRDRFQSAQELVDVLEPKRPATSLSDVPTAPMSATAVRRPPATTKGMQPTPTTPIPRIEPNWTPRQRKMRKKGGGVLVGLLVLFLLGGGGAGGYWYLLLGGQWPPQFPAEEFTLATLWTAIRGSDANAQAPPAVSTVLPDSLESVPPIDVSIPEPIDSMVEQGADSVVASEEAGDSVSVHDAPTRELPNTGTLELRGVPGLGRVTVNGEEIAASVLTVPAGSHRIRVMALGYEDYTTTVAVGRGERIIVQVEMRRAERRSASQQRQSFSQSNPGDACALPGPNYNGDGSCFDAPPVAGGDPVVPLSAGVKVAPPPAILWLRIEDDGRVGRIIPASKTEMRFARRAAQVAKQLPFRPAQKDGLPVAAWIRMTFEGEPGR